MKTRTYKTIKGLASQTNQLTAQNVISGQFCHKKHGWIDFRLDDTAMENFFNTMVNIIGGNQKGKISVAIRYKRPSHWAFTRIIWSGDRWQYYASQDYIWELNALRKHLYNL